MVIIDDASDDQTAAVVKLFISQTGQERIQLLQRQHPTLKPAREMHSIISWFCRMAIQSA